MSCRCAIVVFPAKHKSQTAYGKCPITLRPQTWHVNTTTGYQLVARTGIGISGLSLAREETRPLSGRSHGAAGAMGGLQPQLQLCSARREDGDVDVNAALMGGYRGGWWARPW
ncbi:hypothetical protein JB92DRAFT_2832016 [Gautieria morchelliformis]|nr:hypothetical protein JB92DRAFT_2832016 [Gautieria morchelliformis]